MLQTNDEYKTEVQRQWDRDACGSHYVKEAKPGTLEWYLEAEAYRYGTYAPWMPDVMEFAGHAGERVLEIGGGMGTDLAQFAKNGALTTDLDLSLGHLDHARTNFRLRGLTGEFKHGDGEKLPFPDNTFDVVYSNGVIHHTPDTQGVIGEIFRVLQPGGKAIIMVYAENSLHYWRNLFRDIGLKKGLLSDVSMGEIMSQSVEISEHDSRPLVKVYSAARLRQMFSGFEDVSIQKRQMVKEEVPKALSWIPLETMGRLMGWNLIVKAVKPGAVKRPFDRTRRKVQSHLRVANNLAQKKWRQSPLVARTTLEEELSAAGMQQFAAWWDVRRRERRTYVELEPETVRRLSAAMPDFARRTIDGASRVLDHRFDLLGSTSYQPVDPGRARRESGYQPIDWYLDPVRGVRFPEGIPTKEWKLFEMRPKDADIKYPWELGRCQHLVTLGQAWRLSGDARYAIEIVDQIEDFMQANPVGIGVNWTCTMDVAIRAANWVLGLALVKDCAALPYDRLRTCYSAVFDHGRFIYQNLENIYEVTSNHFLSNVIGLHFIACEFRETASGRQWDQFCRKSLETEIDVQILPDGADFESSVPYHRLVTELFMGSSRLAEHQGRPLSDHYRERLADMVRYLVGVMRPDGLMPQLGDADDGRLHIFTDYATWQRQDARHILGPASHHARTPEWLAIGGPQAAWEAVWWGYPLSTAAATPAVAPPENVHLYADAGAFIARRGGNYLLVTNAIVGTKGFGNHKHNDQLGFELHVAGRPFVVDPGSYVYTSDFAARNAFRSTAGHSTLQVDGGEQNEVNPEWLFRMFEKANARHLEAGREHGLAVYRGEHTGFHQLPSPVRHERAFKFDLDTGGLDIRDIAAGSAEHDLVWRFHLAPGIAGSITEPGRIALACTDGTTVSLAFDRALSATIEDGWYSPSYGVREPAKVVVLSARSRLGPATEWSFVFRPAAAGDRG